MDCLALGNTPLDTIKITESEDEKYPNVIELTSSSSSSSSDNEIEDPPQAQCWVDRQDAPERPKIKIKTQSRLNLPAPYVFLKPPAKTPVPTVPLYVDDDDENEPEDRAKNDDDDDAILILDDPTSARRPIKISSGLVDIRDCKTHSGPTDSSKDSTLKHKSKKHDTREKRMKYAEELFSELNEMVFKDGLPKETKLTWNKRLLTTAGRAKWRRTKEGSHYTEIELSEKILDCNERIRNTLSHEMCHLATWIIDADPKQAHGRLWKHWAAKVMKKRPEIEITTRHSYKISYPYQWKCEKCSKIYGRFSKSIHPDECVCGSCKEGRLLPLFSVQKRVQKTSSVNEVKPRMPSSNTITCDSPSDHDAGLNSESEVEILLMTLQNVTLQ